ncbi:LLM class flavin-dependent oxidoreductase [Pseudobacter ginsenosidimutans]|uniref:Putative LLM family oxidoreductase n=1 Tax=Pseudobacter ginsenosidimutans TaxID=661488 RepID=A0A4Q7N4A6_9BACT|nr:LLM class flavin-dependent oxidoreductase [Pseudobacter ginsenosidimutans]QEC44359.1 LLM class flavin-dependent oxidoreductase [Pseudobacter ginsenosidimutans]RZS75825.1 putative LLM family oxidoreductase [Pseudobacter ginsenosidimutans]
MEIGISTFVERTPDPSTGITISPQQRLADLLEEAVLLEQVGLDVFAVGEHHRPDFVASSPAVILAAIAAKTKKIKLSSAVTVLSSDDPVRVFQDFATLDLLSEGRAEIMAGRGSFIESFPLFGYNLDDYDELFAEKLELLIQLTKSEKINWQGKHRPAIRNLGIYPRPFQQELPVWVAVGGTPQSVIRAAKYGLPLALAIIGGSPDHFVPLVKLYKEEYAKAGHDPAKMQIGVHSHGYIADSSDQAALEFYPPYQHVMTQLGKERGWPPMSPQQYQALRSKKGALLVGDPNEVTDKILHYHELFGLTRFLLHISVGTLPHKQVMHAIELLGTKVAPAVKKHQGQ